jgi:hypothetical protein
MRDPTSHGVTFIDQKPRSVSNPDPSRIVAIPFKLRQACEVVGISGRECQTLRGRRQFSGSRPLGLGLYR